MASLFTPSAGFDGTYRHRLAWFGQHTYRVQMLIAANEAFRVLPLYEKAHPGDMRPRLGLEMVWAVADGETHDPRARGDAYEAIRSSDSPAVYAAAQAAGYATSYALLSNASAIHHLLHAVHIANVAHAVHTANIRNTGLINYGDTDAEQDRRLWQYLPVKDWSLRWHTADTMTLATRIYEGQLWELCPVLADALMDAECEHEGVLHMLRECGKDIGRGCWVIDKLRLVGSH